MTDYEDAIEERTEARADLFRAQERVRELTKRVEEYAAALETALVMIENGDFRNGVSEYGVDEGMVGASKMIDELSAVLAKRKP